MGITRLGKSQMGSRRTARRNKKKFEDQRRADHLLKHGTGGVTKAKIKTRPPGVHRKIHYSGGKSRRAWRRSHGEPTRNIKKGKAFHPAAKDNLQAQATAEERKARIAALRAEREAEREEEKKIFKKKQQRAFNSARAEMIQKVTNSKTIAKMSARQKREVAKRTEVLRLSYFGLKEQVEEEERAQARAARRAARKRR